MLTSLTGWHYAVSEGIVSRNNIHTNRDLTASQMSNRGQAGSSIALENYCSWIAEQRLNERVSASDRLFGSASAVVLFDEGSHNIGIEK